MFEEFFTKTFSRPFEKTPSVKSVIQKTWELQQVHIEGLVESIKYLRRQVKIKDEIIKNLKLENKRLTQVKK